MDKDDLGIGYVLTRREALALIGSTALLALIGCTPRASDSTRTSRAPGTMRATGSLCVVRPQQTEGPYFVDERLQRSDIRPDPSDGAVKPGALLQLTFRVSRIAAEACTPLAGVLVDAWHCDHLGVYSDVQDPGFNTVGKRFLRGYQVTDANGVARFTTIYPGWYQGRAVHIHFKIRSAPSASPGFEFTSQLYFDDALTDRVHAQQPYAAKGQRTLRNSGDGIFRQGGSQLLLDVPQNGQVYTSTFNIALQTGD